MESLYGREEGPAGREVPVPDIGSTIRAWRRRAGLRQGELADLIGMRQPNLARLEAGGRMPRVDTVARILAACGAEIAIDPIEPVSEETRRRIRERLGSAPLDRMPSRPGFRPARLLSMLAFRRVRHVLVGDLAARLHGAPIDPGRVEVCLEDDPMNHQRLRKALRTLHGRRFTTAARIGTAIVRPVPGPMTGYDELVRGAEPLDVEHPLLVASLDDLLRIARHGCRPSDRRRARLLAAVRRERRT